MTRRISRLAPVMALATVLSWSGQALAFGDGGCGEGKCTDCHSLSREEAGGLLGGMVDGVLDVRESKVPGLWAVDVEKQGRKIPAYVDFSKRFLIAGDVVEIQSRESLTRERAIGLNRVDAASIPLDDAVVIGDPKAPYKVVVFDDPECPYCRKIHPEMKRVVEQRPNVVFFIKMFPLKSHPDARRKAQAIVCARSEALLEASLEGRPIPDPTCETDQIEKNEALAQALGIRSTPTLVFPDGRVAPGYKTAEKILAYLDEDRRAPK